LIGSTIVGLGHFAFSDYRIVYLLGYLIFISGLLIISTDKFSSSNEHVISVEQ